MVVVDEVVVGFGSAVSSGVIHHSGIRYRSWVVGGLEVAGAAGTGRRFGPVVDGGLGARRMSVDGGTRGGALATGVGSVDGPTMVVRVIGSSGPSVLAPLQAVATESPSARNAAMAMCR